MIARHYKHRMISVPAAMFMLCLFVAASSWGWNNDSNENTAVFTPQPNAATTPHIISDGWGGAFITAGSADGPDSTGIYTQRLDANGSSHAGWPAAGAVQTVTGQEESQLISDGAGGVIVVWDQVADSVNDDIYAQRYDAKGVPLWGDGVLVATAPNDQGAPQLATDGAGGAIVVWHDYRSGTNYDIYALRIDASGTPVWPNAVQVSAPGAYAKIYPQIASDGAGGAFIVWNDFRNADATSDLYVRRVATDGSFVWPEVAISTAANDQANPHIMSDGAGGAIIVWEDYRNDPGNGIANIYAQRFDAGGTALWAVWNDPTNFNGIQVGEAPLNDQQNPQIVSDGAGGAIVAWQDDGGTGGATYQVWAQQIAADGSFALIGGMPVSQTTAGAVDQWNPQLVSDGVGGAIVAWEDNRNYSPDPDTGTGIDIYAQRIAINLNDINNPIFPAWNNDAPVSEAVGDQKNPQLVSDGSGGAIVTWDDGRSGSNTDVYAQRLNADGSLSSFTTPSFDVTFAAGTNGSVAGFTVQTVISGASAGAAVAAVPAAHYHFVNWTGPGGFVSGDASPVVPNVTAATTITANFAIDTFTVKFAADGNGSVTGTTTQVVDYNGSTTGVTAAAVTVGYHFVNWTGDNGFVTTTENPLTVSNVAASQNITANFAPDSVTVTFAAAANGSVTGTPSQTVNYGTSTTEVSAAPTTAHYHFVNWTGDNGFVTTTANPLSISSVTVAQNITANFAIDTNPVNFTAGASGQVTGSTSQTIDYGANATTVTAVPSEGYHFVNWTGDGGFVTTATNPLDVFNVTAAHNITANFVLVTGILNPSAGKTAPDASDALRALKIAAQQITPTSDDLLQGDVAPLSNSGKPKGNGTIDYYDVISILRMTVGLI